MKHSFKDWFLATRPWSFPASVMPVLIAIGYVYASQEQYLAVDWINGVLALLGMVLFHASGNLISDYYDFKKGIDTKETHGATMLIDGTFQSQTILRYGLTLLAIGSAIGAYLLYSAGMGLLWIGILGIISVLFYTFFKAKALGDALVLLAFGILPMLGAGYSMTSTYIVNMIYLGITIGLPTVSILHANNVRDMISDGKASVTTFAAIVGLRWSQILYASMLILPLLLTVLFAFVGILPFTSLIVFLSLPVVVRNIKMMMSVKDDLNSIAKLDMLSAQLQMIFGLLLTISLFIG